MKGKIGNISKLLVCLVLVMVGTFFFDMGETKAATSYTNAREFYESTGNEKDYHAEAYNGNIYYATCAKKASSSTNLKYGTLGYDVSLSANGQTVSFCVKRNGDGSMQEVSGSGVEYNGYVYNLYCIPAEKIFTLAKNSDLAGYLVVSSGTPIEIYIDAIMTTHQNGTYHGGVSETGGWGEWGTTYHLKDEADLKAIKSVFSGHTFVSFYDIKIKLDNSLLSVRYNLDGGIPEKSGYDVKKDEKKRDMLYQNKALYVTSARILQQFTLVNPNTIKLTKKGYKLESGKEWGYSGRYFDYTKEYMPKDIDARVGTQNFGAVMKANWQPITYTVKYDTNDGDGIFADQLMTYDKTYKLHGKSTRKGYKFTKWKNESSGKTYDAGESVTNLTDKDGATITLTAVWEPEIYEITTNDQGGSGGTDKFYEKYNTGWYSDEEAKTSIPKSKIEIPTRPGYVFQGYWTGTQKAGDKVVNEKGKITAKPNSFSSNATIYAYWEPAKYTITFNKQGGTGGTSTATATYGKGLPDATAPTKTGYSFKGYYTEEVLKKIEEAKAKNEKYTPTGIYYDENMNGSGTYTETKNITLYAYWVDDIAPTVTISAEPVNWTNGSSNKETYGVQCVRLNIKAEDDGSGLASITLKNRNGKITGPWENLNGEEAKTYTCTYNHTEEGSVDYTVVVVDEAGNEAEAKTVAYYDVTPPKLGITEENQEEYVTYDGEYITISPFFVTDYY